MATAKTLLKRLNSLKKLIDEDIKYDLEDGDERRLELALSACHSVVSKLDSTLKEVELSANADKETDNAKLLAENGLGDFSTADAVKAFIQMQNSQKAQMQTQQDSRQFDH